MSSIDFKYPLPEGHNAGPCFMTLFKPDKTPVAMADLFSSGTTIIRVQFVEITFYVDKDCRATKTDGQFLDGLYLQVGRKEGMQYYSRLT
ncbi:hypothetical protein PoMZ_02484 [Pyricularia oryzae]|uniref:Uncharacterized protein n=1 Tax=Pyricularia oryzae TaxID=318829 RepID=A0A4V1C5U0_PYROR|nr:hypothetical protein PoMZ_02484 [Pyricularia oryzae]